VLVAEAREYSPPGYGFEKFEQQLSSASAGSGVCSRFEPAVEGVEDVKPLK
jgi:hypothetical protein